jgi:hypothetical protein
MGAVDRWGPTLAIATAIFGFILAVVVMLRMLA